MWHQWSHLSTDHVTPPIYNISFPNGRAYTCMCEGQDDQRDVAMEPMEVRMIKGEHVAMQPMEALIKSPL